MSISPAELSIHSCLWDNCSERFGSLSELAAHIAASHMNPLSSFQCKWRSCPYNFQTKFLLIQHIYSQHLSAIVNYQEMFRSYYPHCYYNQDFSSGVHPRMDKRFAQFYQSSNNLILQSDISQSSYVPHVTYVPYYLYQNYTIPQGIQLRSQPAQSAILTLGNGELNFSNNGLSITTDSTASTGQGVPLRGFRYHTVESQIPSTSSLVIRQNAKSRTDNHNLIQEKDDSPIQCFSHSKASSSSTQRPQDQISNDDLREEIEELRNLVTNQSKELYDKLQELNVKDEEIKKISDDNNEKSREIVKLQSLISLKESEIDLLKENLDLQTNVTRLLQEQNRRADDKLRRMWAEMLCRKAHLSEEGRESSSRPSKKRCRDDDKDSDLHPMEIPSPPHEKISIITEALICNWEDCDKTFRTKLALKAHIVSTHMGEDILKVPVIDP